MNFVTKCIQNVSVSIDRNERPCNLRSMKHSDPQPAIRELQIIDAAIGAFASYGYRRTSMEDIANGAGMSRSALYLHYKNKEAIFQAIVSGYLSSAAEGIKAAMTGSGSVHDQLHAAFVAKDGPVMAQVFDSPHGAELMDAGFAIGSALFEEFSDRMTQVIASWISAGVEDQRMRCDGCPPEVMARTILAALVGQKKEAASYEDYLQRRDCLARMFAAALTQ